MKFAPPPIRPPQPPPNDLHFFWLNRVDLRYYWSFNSLLPKNNIEYIQTGPPFHTINADVFSKHKRSVGGGCGGLIGGGANFICNPDIS
jgi:hypothetical protein